VIIIVLAECHKTVTIVELKTVITKRSRIFRFRKRRQLATRKPKKARQIIKIAVNSAVGSIFQYSEPKKMSSHKAARIRPTKRL
jgi:hypothetical protein